MCKHRSKVRRTGPSSARAVEALEGRRLLCALPHAATQAHLATMPAEAVAAASVPSIRLASTPSASDEPGAPASDAPGGGAAAVGTGYVPMAPTTQLAWATGYFAPAGLLDLQGGAPAAPVPATMAATYPTVSVNANGLPLLQSRPSGAGLELFLDFSFENGYYHPFSHDGDRQNFNAVEQRDIFNAWRDVASAFSMFDVNVTTVLPYNNHNFAWIAITNEFVWGGEGGQPHIGQTRGAFAHHTFALEGNIPGLIHELGHNLGMWHSADYDYLGNKTHEYTNGINQRNRTFMGGAFWGVGANYRFYNGRTSEAAWASQDQIASALYWISLNIGGDGFRPDDYGNTVASALNLGNGTGSMQRDGYLERPGDNDVFKITPTTSGRWEFAANPLYMSTARPVIQLEDVTGKVLAIDDDAGMGGANYAASFTANVQAGQTYYVRVTWDGDYSSLGYYNLSVAPLPANFNTMTIGDPVQAGSAAWDPASNTLTHIGGGRDTWQTVDQEQFTYATLNGDGVITAKIDGLDNIGTYSKAGIEIRQAGWQDSPRAYIGRIPGGALEEIARTAYGVNAFNPNGSPGNAAWVRIERFGNRFDYSYSADGVAWSSGGSVNVTMSGPVMIGFTSSAWSNRLPLAATFSSIAVEGRRGGTIGDGAPVYNALPAPANLVVVAAAGQTTDTSLTWNASTGATGYAIERSNNGVDYYEIATVGAPAGTDPLTYRDTGTGYAKRWFYRVKAIGAGNTRSAPSNWDDALNKPAAPGMTWGYTSPDVIWNTSEIFITWNDSHGENGYRIERSTDNVNFVVDRNVGANITTANFGGLQPGQLYWFRITPTSAQGDGVPATIASQTRMAAVSNLRFTQKSSDSMTIAWNDAPLESGYRIERSQNGVDWTFVRDEPAGDTSWTDDDVVPGAEYYYRVQPFNGSVPGNMSGAIFAAAPAASLPSGWINADVGAVAGTGAAVNTGAGAWQQVSGGGDVAGAADAFNFTYRALTTNTSITARVDAVEGTNNAAKAGVMFRQDLTPGSKFAAIMLNAGGGFGIDVRSRGVANTNYTYQSALANAAAPYWLKLSRAGSTITAAYSADGVSFTTAATLNVSLSGTFYVGMAVTSFSATQLNTSTFSNVAVGAPPSVATPASASPGTVTGTTTNLSVLGADAAGEAALTYAWAVTEKPAGAADPTYSANGTNAAKNTTATFTSVGSYTFTVTITNANGLSTTSTTSVAVQPSAAGLGITPGSPTVPAGGVIQLTAAFIDQFGNSVSSQPSLAWSLLSGAGSVDPSTGVYTAPASGPATAVIRAATADGVHAATTAVTVVPVNEAVAWYKFNESAGATAYDDSGHGRDATLSGPGGGAGFAAGGASGNALSLSGGGYASLPSGIVSGVTGNFTVATWVKLDTLDAAARVFEFANGANSYMYLTTAATETGKPRFAITTTGGAGEQVVNSSVALTPGTWTHLAVRVSGNTATMYVNGAAVGTNAATTLRPSALGATSTNYLGKSQSGTIPALAGDLDDFRIYARSLSTAEVLSLGNANRFAYVLGNRLYVDFSDAPLTLGTSGGGANVTVTRGTTTLSFAQTAFADVLATGTPGADELTLAATMPRPLTFASGTGDDGIAVAAGAGLQLNADASVTSAALSLEVSGTVTFASPQRLWGLTLNAGGRAAIAPGAAFGTRTLEVAGPLTLAGGTLDLADQALVVRSQGSGAAGQSAARQATTHLRQGLENGGNFDWLGTGISSTAAATANAAAGSVLYGMGVIQNNVAAAGTPDGTTADETAGNALYTTFAGVTVGLNDVLIRYTYMGDADLDGAITGTDYSLIDGGFALGLSGWLNGDFDYGGEVDATDYALIDNAFAFQDSD